MRVASRFWSSSMATNLSQRGASLVGGLTSSMWYTFPVSGSNSLPTALFMHWSLERSNQTTASRPLLISLFGGYSFSVGCTNRNASEVCFSLSIGSCSVRVTYPLKAVSKSFAWAYVEGKSMRIQPSLAGSFCFSISFLSSSIFAWSCFGSYAFFFFFPPLV